MSEETKSLTLANEKPSPYPGDYYQTFSTEPTAKELDARRVPQLSLISQILNPNAKAGQMDRNTIIRANGSTLVVRPAVFEEYTLVVSQYSQRLLTKATDALRAIDGVLTVLSNGFQADMLYGLPESFLDAALLWRAMEPLERRCADTIPSWSWAGWQGRVEYQATVEVRTTKSQRNWERSTKIVKSRTPRDKDGTTSTEHLERLRPWAQWYTASSAEVMIGEQLQSRPVNLEGMGIRGENERRPEDWTRRERDRDFPTRVYMKWTPRAVDPATLQLYTLRTAAFQLSYRKHLDLEAARNSPDYRKRDGKENGLSDCLVHEILIKKDYAIGHVSLDSPLTNDERELNLIVLSEAHLFDDLQLNAQFKLLDIGEDDFRLFNVMVVALDTTSMVAQRMGIGKLTQFGFYSLEGVSWGGIALR